MWAYCTHGLFLLVVAGFLLWQTGRVLRRFHVRDLQGLAVPVGLGALVVAGGLLLSLVIGARDLPAPGRGPLLIWAVVLFPVPGQHRTCACPTADRWHWRSRSASGDRAVRDIGRQNTVFKFYLQVWFFLSAVSAVALAWMLPASARWRRPLRYGWQVASAAADGRAAVPDPGHAGALDERFNAETRRSRSTAGYMPHAVPRERHLVQPEGDTSRSAGCKSTSRARQ